VNTVSDKVVRHSLAYLRQILAGLGTDKHPSKTPIFHPYSLVASQP